MASRHVLRVSLRAIRVVLAVLVVAAAVPVSAIRFELHRAGMGVYDASRRLQFPEWRVGVFARDAAAAKFAPGSSQDPFVDIDVRVANPPHEFAELFVYRWEAVRDYPDWHPCKGLGQSEGAQLPWGSADDGLSATRIVAHGRNAYGELHLRGRANLTLTGMYVLHINACKFEGSSALRNVSGWHTARMMGHITVENPYGGVPGQAYGFLPFTILYAIIATAVVAATWAVFFCGTTAAQRVALLRRHVPGYQIGTTIVLGFTMLGYYLLLAYFAHLNVTNRNALKLYDAALAVLAMRRTAVRVGAFLFAIGHGITTSRNRYLAGVVAVGLTHLVLGLLSVFTNAVAGAATPVHGTVIRGNPEPVAAVDAMVAITAALEVLIVLFTILAFRRTLQLLRANGRVDGAAANHVATRREQLAKIYRRVAAVYALGVILRFSWFVLTRAGWLDFARLDLDQWKTWWLPDTVYEGMTVLVLSLFGLVTLPTKATLGALVPGTIVDLDDFQDLAPSPSRAGGEQGQQSPNTETDAAATARTDAGVGLGPGGYAPERSTVARGLYDDDVDDAREMDERAAYS